jgi:hypothetical protein
VIFSVDAVAAIQKINGKNNSLVQGLVKKEWLPHPLQTLVPNITINNYWCWGQQRKDKQSIYLSVTNNNNNNDNCLKKLLS